MKNKINKLKGFTLVELLIVIALIAILSVAVLATINPVEQSNKARDARVQNDAAEVLNAYERYYATQQQYPWELFLTNQLDSGSFIAFRSDDLGFGICNGVGAAFLNGDANVQATSCSATDANPNLLVSSSELKSSFAGKDEFERVRTASHPEYALWAAKVDSGTSIYMCYIPKANANRIDASKMKCLNTTTGVILTSGDVGCAAVVADWADVTAIGTEAMLRCIPE
jgi:prepilin-type N-terminal cleavage/methylation domain-containing protein